MFGRHARQRMVNMKHKPRKSQVDVALTIGSIIIPVAALFGALVFAFVMINSLADAAKVAAVIAYDTATLADIAYSVPDQIKIYYQPPSVCEFVNTTPGGPKNMISCLNGFMNLTGPFQFRTVAYSTQIKEGCTYMPYSLDSYIRANLPKDIVKDDEGRDVPQPYIVPYPAYANIKDLAVIMRGNDGRIDIDVNGSIVVQKSRQSIYDSLLPMASYEKDPLYQIVLNMMGACTNEANRTSFQIFMPHNYNINVSTDQKTINLTRFRQSPLNIISTGVDYTGWSTLYSVNLPKLNKFCSFTLNSTFADGIIEYNHSKGNSVYAETNITSNCASTCDNNTDHTICDGCTDGSTGYKCAKQLATCTSAAYSTMTRLIVEPVK